VEENWLEAGGIPSSIWARALAWEPGPFPPIPLSDPAPNELSAEGEKPGATFPD
jgi:hypothetical protein